MSRVEEWVKVLKDWKNIKSLTDVAPTERLNQIFNETVSWWYDTKKGQWAVTTDKAEPNWGGSWEYVGPTKALDIIGYGIPLK